MAVSVSRDLTVEVLEDVNATKLMDKQQALRAAIQRGEPKSLGVSQVMLGLMVMSYSIPLHFTEFTEVVSSGVPWWSGLMFITAGVIAIVLDKQCTMRLLQVCLGVTVVAAAVSVLAAIIYSVDMGKNPATPCEKSECSDKHYATRLSQGLKSSLLLFTLAQMAVSAVLCILLYRQRQGFGQYASISDAASSAPTPLIPPSQN
ncbi:unnamed protein product [Ophioblennius macclurei]